MKKIIVAFAAMFLLAAAANTYVTQNLVVQQTSNLAVASASSLTLSGANPVTQSTCTSPNGSLSAAKGSVCFDAINAKTWQNTDGATAWSQIGGSVTGTGSTGDLMAWSSSTGATNYAGSAPSACSSGASMTQIAEAATGALTPTCAPFVNAGTNGVTVSSSTASLDSTYSPTFAGLTDTGPFATSGTITVTDTGTIDNYNPTGFSTASVMLFNNASILTLTGFAGGVSGRHFWACNVGASVVNIDPETVSTASTATNRIQTLTGVAMQLNGTAAGKPSCGEFLYIGGSTNRWVMLYTNSATFDGGTYTWNATLLFNSGINVQNLLELTGAGHISCNNLSPPTLSSCGTSPTVVGCDTFMRVTTGTGATGCTITFNTAWNNSSTPACSVYPNGGAAFPALSHTGQTAITLGSGTAASTTYDIRCGGTG